MRYLDVWEYEAACERFTEERLHPVVGRARSHAIRSVWSVASHRASRYR